MTASREVTPKSLAVAGSALVGTCFSGVTFASIAISVFLIQIASDYNWSRASIGGAVAFMRIGMAIGAPLFGRLIDRKGARAVLLPMTVSSGILLILISFMGSSLPLFYAAHLLLGLCQPGAVAYSKLLSTWFFRHRGIALTTLGFGTFAAKFAVPPLASALGDAFGWHGAYRALALIELLVAFPILFAFFRERRVINPETSAVEVGEVRPDGAPPIGVRQAMSSGTFWLLVGAEAGAFFAFMGISTHAIGILTEHGVTSSLAVWGLSIFAAGGLCAQLISGVLLDRFDTPRVPLPFSLMALASLLLLQIGQGNTAVLTAFFLFGLGCGALTSTTSYFTTRYFGVRNFSTIYGVLFPAFLLISAPAPVILGAIFDATGSYDLALAVVALAVAIGIICLWRLKPYPYPDKTLATGA
jgi:MFS family permease